MRAGGQPLPPPVLPSGIGASVVFAAFGVAIVLTQEYGCQCTPPLDRLMPTMGFWQLQQVCVTAAVLIA